jgi:hypothetical protein
LAVGIYGNIAAEATYPITRSDADGRPLDGSKANCTLTFADGDYPPVNAFWSLTMYDGKTRLLIENPINRYLINSPFARAVHSERFAWLRQGIKLAARAGRTIYLAVRLPGQRPSSFPSCRRAKGAGSHRGSAHRAVC